MLIYPKFYHSHRRKESERGEQGLSTRRQRIPEVLSAEFAPSELHYKCMDSGNFRNIKRKHLDTYV